MVDNKNIDTFECVWCKDAGCTPEEYTFPNDEIGGYDKKTRKTICQNCRDEARDEA